MINAELTLSQLSRVSGSGVPNPYAKLQKPKLKGDVKPLTLKDIMKPQDLTMSVRWQTYLPSQ